MQRVNTTSFRWTMDAAGDWLCIQTNKARQVIDSLKDGKAYDVEIKEHREKRSLDANAYFWEIGGNHEIVCVIDSAVEKLRNGWEHNGLGWQTDTMASRIPGCTNVILYYGSSTYNTRQMSHLIDMAVQDCVEQGIETLSPDKLAGMMEEWGCTK